MKGIALSITFFQIYVIAFRIFLSYAARMADDILTQIKRRATNARVSLTELSRIAGVSPATFTRWNNGSSPWMRTIRKIEYALEDLEASTDRI